MSEQVFDVKSPYGRRHIIKALRSELCKGTRIKVTRTLPGYYPKAIIEPPKHHPVDVDSLNDSLAVVEVELLDIDVSDVEKLEEPVDTAQIPVVTYSLVPAA